jgi:CubicO group peptidase (beta-lactamase class C family)
MKAALLFVLVARAAAQYYPPPDAEGGWRSRAPKTDQLRKLDEAFEYARQTTKHGGLLVVHRGWLVYEKYFGRGHREATPNLASCGKAFTSIAAGILIHERPDLFPDGLDQKVFTPVYLPAEAFPLTESAKAEIRLGQLLAMSAGLAGNTPGYVDGMPVKLEKPGPDGYTAMIDEVARTTPLWTKPGGGYCYATVSPHIVSMMVRHVARMELQQYLGERVAKPLGWGRWGFGYVRPEIAHTPGGGGIAIRPSDALRFAYLLLREGRWRDRQIIPREYVRHCGRRSPYNPHFPYSLQFDVNSGGQAPGAPRAAYWKGGSGGHAIYIVPSMDLVVFKLGGRDEQYDLSKTNVPPPASTPAYDGSRESWKPGPGTDAGLARTLELVVAAIR